MEPALIIILTIVKQLFILPIACLAGALLLQLACFLVVRNNPGYWGSYKTVFSVGLMNIGIGAAFGLLGALIVSGGGEGAEAIGGFFILTGLVCGFLANSSYYGNVLKRPDSLEVIGFKRGMGVAGTMLGLSLAVIFLFVGIGAATNA